MKKFFLFLWLVCCVAVNSFAQTALQTSFESAQGYSLGSVASQNGWTVTSGSGAATVINTLAKTGSQSLRLTASNTALKVDNVAYGSNVPGITADVYVDMWVNPASFVTKGLNINGYDLFGGSQKRIFVIEFTTDNKIKAYNGSTGSNIGTWTANQWVRISLHLDFSAEQYQVAVNGVVGATNFAFRETYTPTASGTRVANVKEFHSLRFNHSSDTQVATSDATVDDIYIGTTAISDVSFGPSSSVRTITVNQPTVGSISLTPSSGPYTVGQSVTATLTLPQGYMNNGWTGDLSGTALVNTFAVASNMTIGANVGIDPANPPPTYTITLVQPVNGTITLSPGATNNIYYKETSVTATITYEACYQFNNWTGDLSGTQATKTFTVQGNMSIGADVTDNNTPAVKRSINTLTEFKNALSAMNPGDTLEVNDGSYNLSSLTVSRSGCSARPIVVTAKNKGQVILNGATALILKNIKNLTWKGFVFQSSGIGTGIKLENCNRVRITENVFNYTETASCTWVYIGDTYGSTEPLKSGYNRVDHNVFDGKTEAGNYIRLDGNIDTQTQYDTIDHNFFKNNGPRATNEKESIRIGVSTLARSSGFTTVEYNLFQDCDGDPEVVSVKSNDNTIRYNTFVRCLGTLCVRQSFRTTVEGNYFFGEGKTAIFNGGTIGCGGIRVYGKDHKIINNYFHGLTGEKWDAAITITNGDVTNSTTSTTDHNLPENIIVAFNTLVNNNSDIEIGFDNNGNYNKAPVNCLIANNIVAQTSKPVVKYYSSASLAGVSFSNNIFYLTQTATNGITASNAEVLNVDPQLVLPSCTNPAGTCNSMRAYQVLRLNASSPAIDQASGSYSYVAKDCEMQPRNGTKDVGAFEYRGASTISLSALDSFHVGPNTMPFSYSYSYSTLPVQLLNFTATRSGESVSLQWNVAQEVNLKTYTVEWSVDARAFHELAVIKAVGRSQYSWLHQHPAAVVYYYRLKMTDTDGTFRYSPVVSVDLNSTAIKVFPNPASHHLTIQLNTSGGKTEVTMFNAYGTVVKRVNVERASSLTIPVQDLAAGFYTIQVMKADGQSSIHKFQISR